MIRYLYRCPKCKFEKEVEHSIKEDLKIICEACGEDTMRRVPLGGQAIFIKKIGGIAKYHGEGRERKKGREDWKKKNPYYDKLPDYL